VKVQQADTPQGKNAPWMVTVSGILGSAVSPPQLGSVFQEFTPDVPPGQTPGTTTPAPTTTPTPTPPPTTGSGGGRT